MKILKLVGLWMFLLGMAACSSHYRMTTRIHRNGVVDREVFAFADSAFMAGDGSRNPFLFSIDSGWNVIRFDSILKYDFFGAEGKQNAMVSQTLSFSEERTAFSAVKEWMRPLVSPQEKLKKNFRWFYTYYTFTCHYSEITEKGPVSMDAYLNEEERKLLFQGDLGSCRAMNGLELNGRLEDLNHKFERWFCRTQFELTYDMILHFATQSGDTAYLSRLVNDKQAIYSLGNQGNEESVDCPADHIVELLDTYYHTTYFSALCRKKGASIDSLLEERCRTLELFEHVMKYELTMPGELLSANTSLRDGNTVIWKVDAYRLLAANYTLMAESRSANIWAFIVTGVLVLFAIYCIIRRRR